ncbi:hypothetical protein LRB11_14725 [Ectothiorhodospira haloalkaliphila]|uniref:hypothetical protein n=1 Tax=Ectothiorhodospira haloalkaliphila TaxID=421628 RepID=UPI001EE80BDD|nr:hypothetical protein [Ectothiorhodospira haloalkaliphila]MCG5526169.1 hypothetical protein [Ectothiorhodospira haloalkaliphila]
MDKYLDALREAGVADSIILTSALFIVVVPIFWKLWREAISLRRSSRKEKLEGVFEVLGSEGVNSHPLQVELAFRELFAVRMTHSEIQYFLNAASPLSSITDYKYGRRYLDFGEAPFRPALSRSRRRLWWQDKFSTVLLFGSAVLLIVSLLFTALAVFADVAGDVVMAGAVAVVASLILAWLFLDEVRAVNAAVRVSDDGAAINEEISAQADGASSGSSSICSEGGSDAPKPPNLSSGERQRSIAEQALDD